VTAFLRNPPWGDPTPVLRTARGHLRPPQPGDWPAWAQLRTESRDFLAPWEPLWAADELTRNAYRRRLRRYARDARDGFGYAFFLFRYDDDSLLGGVTLTGVRRGVTQSCSLGYWMGRRHAGRGYMKEAVLAVLPFVFDELRLHRLEAACLPNNEPSKGVLRACGFTEEGYARQYLRINGAWRDHVLFALLGADPRPRLRS